MQSARSTLTPTATPKLEPSGGRIHPAAIASGLVVVTMLIYWQVTTFDFVKYDDDDYFAANPHVQAGLSLANVAWAFQTTHAGNWHPLTWLSLMADAEFFGTGPTGPHFTNLLLHALNAVLVFLLVRRLTGANGRSALVAALFAWHPLHVESVAWVSERKDVLSAAFGLMSLWAYAEYVRRGADRGSATAVVSSLSSGRLTRWYWLALLFLALGLLSKPMLVTLPFVMLLLDWWPLRRVVGWEAVEGVTRAARTPIQLVVEKLPFFMLSVASCLVTYWVQNRGGAVHSLDSLALWPRVGNAFVAYARYLYKTVWPVDLAIYYPHPVYWAWPKLIVGILVVAGGLWFGFRRVRSQPWLLVGISWFLGMLVPVIGLVQVGTQSMADRYSYLPLIGLFIAAIWAAAAFVARSPVLQSAGRVAVILVLTACAMRTFQQVGVWRNSETLFRHASKVTRGNAMAHYNLGAFYFDQGRPDEAIAEYRATLNLNPNHTDALVNLGVVLASRGELDAGIAAIRSALQRRPDLADAHYNLGNALVLKREFDEAQSCYEAALRLEPDSAEAHNNLGNLLAMRGQRNQAESHFREVLRLMPDHVEARRQLERISQARP